MIDHCPGRSLRRKSHVFDRMQRARLFLEGNVDRNVRLAELAELGDVTTWYFTKIFHALYGEGPQAMAARLRLNHAAQLLQGKTVGGRSRRGMRIQNNCSFSRAFRDRYGLPPSIYRMNASDFMKIMQIHGRTQSSPCLRYVTSSGVNAIITKPEIHT